MDGQEDTIGISHSAFVATAVEVIDGTFREEPSRTDGHIDLVVTAKDAIELHVGMEVDGIQAHCLQAVIVQYVGSGCRITSE